MRSKDADTLAKVLWFYGLSNINSSTEKIVCPFHEDVNPSLILDFENNNWFCFGCQCGGDAQKFAMMIERKYNNLNELQALKKYYQILKSDKCKKIKIGNRVKQTKESREFYAESYDYFHGLSKINWETDKSEDVEEAREYMVKRGYDCKTLSKVDARITYNSQYSIIFPIMDNKKFRGWVCRTTKKEVEAKRKYLYNKGFSRSNTVVGDYGSKDFVFVVEGYMDRLKFIQFGITNVVAIFGWKMSGGQFEKLRKAGIKKVISALDNDECGRKGTKYLQQIFGKENVTRFTYLKCLKDVGEATETQFNKMYNKTMKNFNQN